ncbi:MAG: hypothetical protein AB1668_05395 [Nanoarchaeota archaeon]
MDPDKNLEWYLISANEAASKGNVAGAQAYLSGARGYAAEHRLELPEPSMLQIELIAYRKGAEVALTIAERALLIGYSDNAQGYLQEAVTYAARVKLNIRARVEVIEADLRKELRKKANLRR